MFGNLDPVRILMILLAGVVLLGPERLPRAARQLGQLWRDLAKLRERLESEVRSAMPDLDLPTIPAIPGIKKGAVRGYITDMMSPAAAGAAAAGGASSREALLEAEGSPELVAAGMMAGATSSLGSSRPGYEPG